MLSNWNNFDIHLILLKSLALIIPIISGVLILCSHKRGEAKTKNAGSRTKKSATSTSIPAPAPAPAPTEATTIAKDSLMGKLEPPKEPVKEPESDKSGTGPVNSVKWLRGRKKAWKSRKGSKKGKKPKKTETDSQHTQVIEMELGKAARSGEGESKLTAKEDQKVNEKPDGKTVQFADKLVKSTLTPTEQK